MVRVLLALSMFALATPVFADDGALAVTAGRLTLDHGFVRATLPGARVGAGFVTIHNAGAADRLIAGTAPFADAVSIHQMTMQGEVMTMRDLPDGLTIPADATVEMAPSGYHLMFTGLKAPLRVGETVFVTLIFEQAPRVDIALPVVAAIPKD